MNSQYSKKQFRTRILLILSIAAAACVLLYFLGFLLVPSIMLVAYVAMLPGILAWERYSKNGVTSFAQSPSNDDRWVKTKMEIEKLQKRIDKAKNESERSVLLSQKRHLENELRNLEWSIRESELTEMYNAAHGNMKKDEDDDNDPKEEDPDLYPANPRSGTPKINQDGRKNELGQETGEGDLRKKEDDIDKRKYLLQLLAAARAVLDKEPQDSVKVALMPLANDLKAHYNAIRKMEKMRSSTSTSEHDVLSDYWVLWTILYSIANGLPVDPNLAKYASEDFNSKIEPFLKLVKLRNPAQQPAQS